MEMMKRINFVKMISGKIANLVSEKNKDIIDYEHNGCKLDIHIFSYNDGMEYRHDSDYERAGYYDNVYFMFVISNIEDNQLVKLVTGMVSIFIDGNPNCHDDCQVEYTWDASFTEIMKKIDINTLQDIYYKIGPTMFGFIQ